MTETVLVTGGTGFVGGHCLIALAERGFTVRATVRSPEKEAAVRAVAASTLGAAAVGERLHFCVADLTADEGWDAAVQGCAYVLHLASPIGGEAPQDPKALAVPARDGALRVLRAATRAGVRRVVLTSSTAAASPRLQGPDSLNDETVWTDPSDKHVNAYRRSKILAERAAWDFMEGHGGGTTLTTILPSAVLGPVLTPERLGSVSVVERLLRGYFPGYPRLGFNIVDVRNLADLHVRAMTAPEAAGERFIAAGDFLWMGEISNLLRTALGARASKVPTAPVPDFVLWISSLFDPSLKLLLPNLGRKHAFTSAKAERVLGWTPGSAATAVVECAESLIAAGVV